MPRAIILPSAWNDLDEITHYLAVKQSRPAVAQAILEEIYAKCDYYALHPTVGQLMPQYGPEYRLFRHKRWVVIYLPIQDGIKVFRIVDGARDFDRLFGSA